MALMQGTYKLADFPHLR